MSPASSSAASSLHPPVSPRSISRSISYDTSGSPPKSSSSRPLQAPVYLTSQDDGNAHASTSYHTGANLATRTRSRSVGSKSRQELSDAETFHPLAQIGNSLDRGPGTPDFVLESQGSPARSKAKGKGRLQDILRDGGEGDGPSAPLVPSLSGKARDDGSGSSARPRLGSRLRSFFTSFSGHEESLAARRNEAKARSSNELSRPDGTSSPRLCKPHGLVIPSARPAGIQPFGVLGLNNESPPLTPTSDEAYEDHGALGAARSAPWTDIASNTESASSLTPGSSRADSPDLYAPSAYADTISLGTGGALAQKGLLAGNLNLVDEPQPLSSSQRGITLNGIGARLQAGLRSRSLRQHMPTLLMLLTFFVFSTLVVVLLLSTLPLRMPSHSLTQLSLSEMRDICLSLRDYATSTSRAYHHTLMVLCIFFTYKQAFNIPGSIVSNIVFGALFGTWRAAFWLSIFTAVGGSGAAIMSALVAPLVLKMPGMTKAVGMMRRAIGSDNVGKKGGRGVSMSRRGSKDGAIKRQRRTPAPAIPAGGGRNSSPSSSRPKHASTGGGNLYSILLLLRVLPLTPYGMMNIACGILNVPLLPFSTTLALGSLPWNAVTAQLGEILVEVVAALPAGEGLPVAAATLGDQLDVGGFHDVSLEAGSAVKNVLSSEKSKLTSAAHKAGGGLKILMAKIWTREMMFKLIGLSLLSLAPVILGKWWKARQAASAAKAAAQAKRRRTADNQTSLEDAAEEKRRLQNHQRHIATNNAGERGSFAVPFGGGQSSAANGLPSWINHSSDDDDDMDEGGQLEDDDDDDDEEYDSSSDLDEDILSSPNSPLSNFAASVAEKSNSVGPALIASLTRSASRNSWRSAVSGSKWFSSPTGSGSNRSSPTKGFFASAPPHSVDESFNLRPMSAQGMTTPQLELAQNPFDNASLYPSKPWHEEPAPSKWGWTHGQHQHQHQHQRAMSPPLSNHGASLSLTHPALDGLHEGGNGWRSASPSHSRQSSAASASHQPPKRFRGVVA